MKRMLIPLYGVLCTLLFVAIFVFLAGFLLGIGVPKSINSGPATNPGTGVAINMALITAFGFFHSLMARPGFKRIWTRIIPKAAERSTYLLQSSLFLALLVWQWRPLPTAIWSLDGWAALPFYLSFAAGLIIVVWSILLIDVLEFVGLRQIWQHQRGQ